jgi:hypothetical protein
VGIGTTSPSAALHVDSPNDGPIFDSGGTGNTNHALLVRDSGNNQLLRVNNNGNVGIGTSSPAGKLHVKTSASGATAVAGADDLVIEHADYGGMSILSENEGHIYFGDNEDADVGRIEYQHNANAMVFRTNATDAMTIDNAGRVTKPNQPCFSAGRLSPSQNITANTQTFVSLNTKEFDIGNNFNTSTYRFTAPVAGRYLFTAAIQFSATGGAHSIFKINGSSRNDGWADFGDASATTQSRIFDLVSGDYVQLAAYHTVTCNMSYDRAKMTGFLIG